VVFIITRTTAATFYTDHLVKELIMSISYSICLTMFCYLFKWALCSGFVYQRLAEKDAESTRNLFNNLPDAILMVSEVKNEEPHLDERTINYQVFVPKLEFHFCNQQAD